MDKRFFLLMIVFLTVGLVPTIVCIIYPPQLAIIEQATPDGTHVGLNNWFTTRDYPTIEIPERLLQKIKGKNTATNKVHIQQNERTLVIETSKAVKVTLAQIYTLKGIHQQSTYLLNNENKIKINQRTNGKYLLLLEVDGTVFLQEIFIQ